MAIIDHQYKEWLSEIKTKIRSAQIKAALSANTVLIEFYWDLGKMLSEKIKAGNWGDKIMERVSGDLKEEFPDMSGFSLSNLKTCKLFYEYFSNSSQLVNAPSDPFQIIGSQLANQLQNVDYKETTTNTPITSLFIQQIVGKIPWGHIKIIITKIKDFDEAVFYLLKTKENNWSRDTLALQINLNTMG